MVFSTGRAWSRPTAWASSRQAAHTRYTRSVSRPASTWGRAADRTHTRSSAPGPRSPAARRPASCAAGGWRCRSRSDTARPKSFSARRTGGTRPRPGWHGPAHAPGRAGSGTRRVGDGTTRSGAPRRPGRTAAAPTSSKSDVGDRTRLFARCSTRRSATGCRNSSVRSRPSDGRPSSGACSIPSDGSSPAPATAPVADSSVYESDSSALAASRGGR